MDRRNFDLRSFLIGAIAANVLLGGVVAYGTAGMRAELADLERRIEMVCEAQHLASQMNGGQPLFMFPFCASVSG